MNEYANFRRSKQLLLISTLIKMIDLLAVFREYSNIISIMKDHWKALEKYDDQATNELIYLKFMEACKCTNDHRKAARYSSRKCMALF